MKKLWFGLLIAALGMAGFVYAAKDQLPQLSGTQTETTKASDATAETTIFSAVSAGANVIVEARIVPQREANLSMAASGIVAEVLVNEGAVVDANTPLIRLQTARPAAALAQAQANLRNAELKLAELQAPARSEEVARYQAAITLAQANLQKVLDGADNADIVAARSSLASAEAVLRKAQAEYDKVAWRTDIGMLPQSTALEQATNAYVAAQARLDQLLAGPKQTDITSAQAQLSAAQADLNNLLAGAQAETIAAAEANVASAWAVVQDAQASLDEMTLYAPFTGTVAAMNVEVGEQVSPGSVIVQLADTSSWRIETDDLNELSAVDVQQGDRVEIAIDALPDLTLSGRVANIKGIGENKQGDITYTVLVTLEEQDERLRWNMTAQTTIIPDEAERTSAQLPAPTRVLVPSNRNTRAEDGPKPTVLQADETDQDMSMTFAEQPEIAVPLVEPRVTATVQTNGVPLNVRAGAGTEYDVIGGVANGEQLTVIGRNEAATWALVELANQATGWVAVAFIASDTDLTQSPLSDLVFTAPGEQPSTERPAVPFSEPAPRTAAALSESSLRGQLVFKSDSGGLIYAYDLESGELRSLTNGLDPAISPDGNSVAFVREGGEHGLYLINIDGSNERLIYNGGEGLRAPAWSPDGQWIALSRITGEYECRSAGGGLCLADSRFLSDLPLVSKDQFGLSRVDVNGNNFRDLLSLNTARAPSWSQAGIAYQSSAGIQITEDVPEADNRVVASEFRYQDPDWQTDGGLIVFHSLEGNHREIFTVNPDGSDLRALTRPLDLLAKEYPQNVAPVWSPDNQHIAFLSNRTDDGGVGEWAIWVMSANGENLQRLPIDVEITYAFQGEQMLSW